MALDWLKDKWDGAVETVNNYYDATVANRTNSDIYTLEMRKKCLARGPIDSAAYRTCLSTQYLLKNPSSIIAIGSVGKVGAAIKAGSTAQKITQVAKAVPKTAVKNLPGLVTSIVRKEIAATAVPKGIAAVSPLLKTTGGKILAVAGGITGIGLVGTNLLDFYNWNGPVQTALKKTFPWLYPVNPKTGKETVYPKIKKMTPQETAQLQELIYQATGQRLSGEALRQAILEKFGITVIEERPRKGESEGPLGTGSITSFQNSVKGSTGKYTIKALPQLMIDTPDHLQEATMNELSAFIQALPGRMAFDYLVKPTYVDADGRRRKGNFAYVKVSILNKKGTRTEVAELPLGLVSPNIGTPTPLDAENVAKQVTDSLKSIVSGSAVKSTASSKSKKTMGAVAAAVPAKRKYQALIEEITKTRTVTRPLVPNTVRIGDFDVEQDWKYAYNYQIGNGGAALIVFNPNDPLQRLLIEDPNGDDANVITRFLDIREGRIPEFKDLKQWYPEYFIDISTMKSLFEQPSIDDQEKAEYFRIIDRLLAEGKLTQAEATEWANK